MEITDVMWVKHSRVYGTPGLPPFSFVKIGDGRLWHGRNPLTAVDVAKLADEKITHVLDLRESWEWTKPGRFGAEAVTALAEAGIIRRHVAIVDGEAPTPEQFRDAVAFLDEVWAISDARIYVHCRLGRERTGAILAAWRARRDRISLDAALDSLRAEGAKIAPLSHQRAAAIEWLTRQTLSD